MRRLAVFMSLLAVLFLGSAPAQAAARVDVRRATRRHIVPIRGPRRTSGSRR
jgi:hypothetical protein